MEIDLGEEIKIKVKIGADEYLLREPMQSDIEKLQDKDEKDAFFDFIIALGMPEDVAKGLGVFRLKKLAEGLTGALSEKK